MYKDMQRSRKKLLKQGNYANLGNSNIKWRVSDDRTGGVFSSAQQQQIIAENSTQSLGACVKLCLSWIRKLKKREKNINAL